MARKEKKNPLFFIKYTILFIIAYFYVIPIAMMVLGSFKNPGEVLAFDLSLPEKWLGSNYSHVLAVGHILRGYKNSIILTTFSTLISIVFGACTGIIITRRGDKISNSLYYYFIFGLSITFQTASTFGLIKFLNIYGTYASIIFIFVALRTPFTVMTFSSFIKGVPKDIDEAAIVDGCNPVQMIFLILFPILKPIMITNIILTAINVWNNFMIPLFYLGRASKWPVTLTIYNFFSQYVRDWQYVFAALTLTVMPMIILFLALQKYIVGGMTNGAVKG
jgi:raffinose/stachyose/melibiose transport system permease protein